MNVRPGPFLPRHSHVHFLNLTAGEVFFEVEIQANQTEYEGDRLGLPGCRLQGEGVRHVLEDKAGASHRVDVDLVIRCADLIDSDLIHGKRSLEKDGDRRKRRAGNG